jgi:hypothetical protein
MALDGTTLYIGGNFTLVGVTARQGLAAINAQTGSLLSWDPGASGGTNNVYKIVPSGSNVYVFGDFTTAGGASRNRAAAISAGTGVATAWDPDVNGDVYDAVINTTTALVYMAGAFTDVGGNTRNYAAAVDLSTGSISGWDPDADAAVQCLSLLGSTMYMGGSFTNIGGAARNKAAAVNINTSLATSWDPNLNGTVETIYPDSFNVYLGGQFTTVGGFARNRMAQVRTFDAGVNPFNPDIDGTVYKMSFNNTLASLYVAGDFDNAGGSVRSKFASLDPNFATAQPWIADAAGGSNVGRAVLWTPWAAFVAGQFTSINAVPKTGTAATVP